MNTPPPISYSKKPWIIVASVFILILLILGLGIGGAAYYLFGLIQTSDPSRLDSNGAHTSSISHKPSSGGKQLRADRSGVQWRSMQWPGLPIHFDVPADWLELAFKNREIEFRPKNRSAYFIAHVTYFDQKIPFNSLLESNPQKFAGQLKREEIMGYARKDFGNARGFIEINRRSDGHTMAVWSGYFDTEEFGTASLSILLGSPTPAGFEEIEPTLGAILESIQFK